MFTVDGPWFVLVDAASTPSWRSLIAQAKLHVEHLAPLGFAPRSVQHTCSAWPPLCPATSVAQEVRQWLPVVRDVSKRELVSSAAGSQGAFDVYVSDGESYLLHSTPEIPLNSLDFQMAKPQSCVNPACPCRESSKVTNRIRPERPLRWSRGSGLPLEDRSTRTLSR